MHYLTLYLVIPLVEFPQIKFDNNAKKRRQTQ